MMVRPAGRQWDGRTDRSKTDTREGDIKVLHEFNRSGPVAATEAGSVDRKYVFTTLARQSANAKNCAIIRAPFTIMHTVHRHNCGEE
jgi:hypothetical protein